MTISFLSFFSLLFCCRYFVGSLCPDAAPPLRGDFTRGWRWRSRPSTTPSGATSWVINIFCDLEPAKRVETKPYLFISVSALPESDVRTMRMMAGEICGQNNNNTTGGLMAFLMTMSSLFPYDEPLADAA